MKVKAPARIDFAGGWTDTNFFCDTQPGYVLNAAINLYAFGNVDFNQKKDDTLGSTLVSDSTVPCGSGLGGSSSFRVVRYIIDKEIDKLGDGGHRKDIAEKTYLYERNVLNIICGRQDQYAATLGGINFMQFFKDGVEVEKLDLSDSIINALEKNLVLVYTGKSRLSSNLHDQVWGNYQRGDRNVAEALMNIREIAQKMKEDLTKGDLGAFANLLNENWENQKRLADCITNDEIESLFEIAHKNGALGGKACGAGGGGCLLFYSEDPARLKLALQKSSDKIKTIPFKFDFEGVRIY